MPSSAAPASSSPGSAGMLAPFVNELDRIAPSFQIHGSQIQVIRTPSDFYETLKAKIKSAKTHVFLSTLYIGKSLARQPEAHTEHLDRCATRDPRSAEPVMRVPTRPLITEFGPERVEIRMYHTPNLTGLRKKHVPKRINEGWGLQHMKLYGVDDEIILSGANLSSDYFTNRQDRYHLISSREITQYFARLYKGVASLSFRVEPSKEAAGFTLQWPSSNAAPSPLEKPSQFVAKATELVNSLIAPQATAQAVEAKGGQATDTTVFMLAQLSQLLKPDTSTELPAVTHVLKTLSAPQYAGSSWTFTAGYFNPAPSLTQLLMSSASTNCTVITASPQANGFYGSKGVSGMLPDAYTYLARRFLMAIRQQKRESDITLKEWRKGTVGEPEGWTYHAKGLWVTLPNESGPSMTVVGSSNYTKRSYSLDLEAGALVVTENADLKKRLADEQKWLQEYAAPVTIDDLAKTERRVSFKVRMAMWFVQMVGGAL
ncbi:uncharacterized protein PG998_008554 [Apiospora kogelbergensis]|uniref:uncharacterized protein n=1 Tax=Apiospora kogelbergensis TaxID=1337665 RepID=UPI003131F2B5